MMQTLTLDERERVVDSALKIQSVRNSLNQVGDKLTGRAEIAACLKSVDQNLRAALGYIKRPHAGETTERRANLKPKTNA